MRSLSKIAVVASMVLGMGVLAGCCGNNDCAPPPPRPRPAPAPTVCPSPAQAFCPPTGPVAYTGAAPVCTTNVCQLVPPGTTIYSDPPTVTVSSTGQVLNQTPTSYYPAPRAGTVNSPNPQARSVSTFSVPRSSNVRDI